MEIYKSLKHYSDLFHARNLTQKTLDFCFIWKLRDKILQNKQKKHSMWKYFQLRKMIGTICQIVHTEILIVSPSAVNRITYITRQNEAWQNKSYKGIFHPRTDQKGPDGEQRCSSTYSATSALDRSG